MTNREPIDREALIASAVQYLIEGDETDLAQLLLYFSVDHIQVAGEISYPTPILRVIVGLRGPRIVYGDNFRENERTSQRIEAAIGSALPYGYELFEVEFRATSYAPDPDWRRDLQELIKGKGVTNQASGADDRRLWQGFRFRSATEIKIAEALDRANLLFFPLPKARVATETGRRNVEPDFVICHEGRWGILEVDGEPFHPAERSAIEHERDRLFRRHGVVCVERFDARKCYADPDKTVQEFLLLMVKSYRRP